MKSRMFIVILFILAAAVLGPAGFVHADGNQLKFGVLPVVQALPLYVAQEKGLFEAEGIKVEVIPFRTALEKDMALHKLRMRAANFWILVGSRSPLS